MLTLIRGLPGSGKSTLARMLCNTQTFFGHKCMPVHFEADMYFVKHHVVCASDPFVYNNNCGCPYEYDSSKIKQAHEWCQSKTVQVLALDSPVNVFVSNTFTTRKEMQYYLDLAKEYGHSVQIITCQGNFGSIHGVPAEVITKMKARWEHVDL